MVLVDSVVKNPFSKVILNTVKEAQPEKAVAPDVEEAKAVEEAEAVKETETVVEEKGKKKK